MPLSGAGLQELDQLHFLGVQTLGALRHLELHGGALITAARLNLI